LDIANKLGKKVAVVTDNDGKYKEKVTNKYKDYESVSCISICASDNETLKTLEPQFADANKEKLEDLRLVLGIKAKEYSTLQKVSDYMEDNKTDWALKVFQTEIKFNYPDYIIKAIKWVHEGK